MAEKIGAGQVAPVMYDYGQDKFFLQDNDDLVNPLVTATTDPVTGMMGWVAAGTSVRVAGAIRGGRSGAIGDSITAPGAGSWFHQLCAYSGGRLRRSINAGIGGNTTAQMVARVVTDLPKAAKLDVVFVTGGTNDVSIADAESVKNLLGMVRYGQSIGADVVWVQIPPRSDTTGNRDKIISKRAAIAAAASRAGVVFIDPWRSFVAPDGGWIVGASSDGVHPVPAAARVAAMDALMQLMPSVSPGWDGLCAMTGVPGAVIATNDLFPDSNADGTPDSWGGYASKALVAAKSIAVGDAGNIWTIATDGVNGSGAVVAGERVEERTLSGLSLAEGTRLAVCARLSLTGYETGIRCHVRANVAGGVSAMACEPSQLSGDLNGAVVWGEATVPAGGATSVVLQIRLVTTGAATPSVGNISVSQLQLWNLTEMGLA